MYFFGDHAKGLPGGGGTPLYKPYWVCAALSGGVFAPYWFENRHFAHFNLESGIVFEGTTECMNVLLPFQSNE